MKTNQVKPNVWLIAVAVCTILALSIVAYWTIHVDPFFHYHKPLTSGYYYNLDNQRSQNNGILKNFDYQGMIIGTSMAENFKASEAEAFFGVDFVKVPYSGASYKEINAEIHTALSHNDDLQIVIRGLDMSRFLDDKDLMRYDQGTYPTYLYDDDPLNDVEYIFNRDVVFSRVYPMTKANNSMSAKRGITSFDDYANWMWRFTFGVHSVFPDGVTVKEPHSPVELTEAERIRIQMNIRQNVTALAEAYPTVAFYLFFTPYSAAWWKTLVEDGTVYKQVEAERVIIEELLRYHNIRLLSLNHQTDIITDLNNYKDATHYGEWINSLILRYMHDGKCLITEDNYQQYLNEVLSFYTTFDYASLNDQEDYDSDDLAAALLYGEIGGDVPIIDLGNADQIELSHAVLVEDQHNGAPGIECEGCLQRSPRSEMPLEDYLRDEEYIGFKLSVEDFTPYHYIVFYGKKVADHGQPVVYIYDENGTVLQSFRSHFSLLDDEWHVFAVDVSIIQGRAYVIFNGGYIDWAGSPDTRYIFSDVALIS